MSEQMSNGDYEAKRLAVAKALAGDPWNSEREDRTPAELEMADKALAALGILPPPRLTPGEEMARETVTTMGPCDKYLNFHGVASASFAFPYAVSPKMLGVIRRRIAEQADALLAREIPKAEARAVAAWQDRALVALAKAQEKLGCYGREAVAVYNAAIGAINSAEAQ